MKLKIQTPIACGLDGITLLELIHVYKMCCEGSITGLGVTETAYEKQIQQGENLFTWKEMKATNITIVKIYFIASNDHFQLSGNHLKNSILK